MTNTTTVKVTKREHFATLAALVENSTLENKAEVLAFIAHEVELLDKKATASKSKAEEKNAELKTEILAILKTLDKPVTITELRASAESLMALNPQKVSAVVSQMVKSGEVVRTEEKRKAYFSVA